MSRCEPHSRLWNETSFFSARDFPFHEINQPSNRPAMAVKANLVQSRKEPVPDPPTRIQVVNKMS